MGIVLHGPAATKKRNEAFFAWVGKCITQWAIFEDHLFRIAEMAIGSEYPGVAALMFWRIKSLEGRYQLVEELLQIRFYPTGKKSGQHDPQILKDWKALRTRTRPLIEFRNFIAHQPAWSETVMIKSDDGIYQRSQPMFYTRQQEGEKAVKPNSLERVSAKEMRQNYRLAVEETKNLSLFRNEIRKWLVKLPPPAPPQS